MEEREQRSGFKWAVLIVAIAALAVIVQINRYEYVSLTGGSRNVIVRADKLTGERCMFAGAATVRKQKVLKLEPC